jgi:hypothetical protein
VHHRRRDRRGRPRQANAKRRATTLAERRSPDDLGSPELVRRKARVANGSAEAVELRDVPGILCAHHLIEPDELLILRLLASWLRQVGTAFRLKDNSAGGLWAAILSGHHGSPIWGMPIGSGDLSNIGNRAMFRLGQLHALFTGPQRALLLSRIMAVAAGETWPKDHKELKELRRGFAEIGELQRRGRRRKGRPDRSDHSARRLEGGPPGGR